MVVIIDYGLGNLASVKKALDFLKIENIITSSINEIKQSSSIILPGVGSFKQGMENLIKKDLINTLRDEVINNKKPFLGICLGMQLIFEKGYEPSECKGLGWISGEVIKIKNNDNLKIPHLGWNATRTPEEKVYRDQLDNNFYFIHSYHVKPKDKNVINTYVHYGEDIIASIKHKNIFATQFHPEKSQNAGLDLLKNYFSLNA